MAPNPQCSALAAAKERKGYSYADIANKIGKSEQHVIDVCTGKVKPTDAEFDALARALDIKAENETTRNEYRSLSTVTPRRREARLPKYSRRLLYLSIGLGAVYEVDTHFYASSLTRTCRTFVTGAIVALDYKINFQADPPFANSIGELHARNSERIYQVLRANGGLYLKIGQAIAMQSAILPPEFQKRFAKMFDDAPQNEWADVERVIKEEFGGRSPEEVFGIIEKKARASASVAQVHWAKLKDGREVAVKIQKKEIEQQVGWDLWAFKAVMYIYTSIFDLPLYPMVPYISQRLLLETDFVNEADNSERMASLVASEPRLRGRVYIPKVYRDLSTRKVMTAEWIEGVRLWDKETLSAPWKMRKSMASPGCANSPLDLEPVEPKTDSENIKPDRTWWKGSDGKGGLGVKLSDVMQTMVDLFSAQIFLWGVVHCDPHPGNLFVRRLPSGKPELVLIDHGLYIYLDPAFRRQYAEFWRSLLAFDNKRLGEISQAWGVTNFDMFASATLMRPYEGGDMSTMSGIRKALDGKDEKERAFEMQQRMRKGIRDILGDEDKWPRELIFLGRNLRIVQGNNQFLGSPVNRVKITGMWASRALVDDSGLPLRQRLRNLWRHVTFRIALFASDLVFYTSWVRQLLGYGQGMESDLEEVMRGMAKNTFGVELNHDIFEG